MPGGIMWFRVLGPVALVDADGVTRTIGSTNQRTVLAALAANRGEVVTLDTLIDALWGDAPPRSAVTTLRTYVSRLRAQIGDVLVTSGDGFVLDVPARDVDAGRFEELVEAAMRAEPAEAVALLDDALALWRGPAFGDRFDVGCVRGEARRLEERRATAREARIAALRSAGRSELWGRPHSLVLMSMLSPDAFAGLTKGHAMAHPTGWTPLPTPPHGTPTVMRVHCFSLVRKDDDAY